MVKNYLKRIITLTIISTSIMAFNSTGASAAWKQDSNGWGYGEGNSYDKGWNVIDGKWYYFDSSGYMAHDTTIEGYKLGSNGVLLPNRLPLSTIIQWTTPTDAKEVSTNSEEKNMVEVTVENAQELVDAIGSNKRILLKPGTYNLSNVKQVNNSDNSVTWKDVYDGKELNIQNIHDLIIEGIEPGQAEINVDSRDAEIMNFNNVSNVTMKNIIAGHTPEPYHCNAGVLGFHNSTDISLMSSELYGCGSIGVELYGVKRLNASNCVIDHCSLRAISIYNSEDIKFTENKIVNHEAYSNIIDASEAKNITFEKCDFADNNNFGWSFIKASDNSNIVLDKCIIKDNTKSVDSNYYDKVYFFDTNDYNGISNSQITIKDSEITGNKCDYLRSSSESVKFENCNVNNNVWQ